MFNQTLRKCTVMMRRTRLNIVQHVPTITIFNLSNVEFHCSLHYNIQKRSFNQNNGPVVPVTQLSTEKNPEEQLQEFRQANEENEKYYKILELEIDVLRHDGEKVPDIIRPADWMTLLDTKSRTKRKKLLEYLWKVEQHKRNAKEKRKMLQSKYHSEKQQRPPEDTGALKYGLQDNHMFIRIHPNTIMNWYNHKLITSMLFEPKVVFDCSYTCMSQQEVKSCAKQIMYAFSENRLHQQQFNLYLCNADRSSMLMKSLNKLVPTLYDPVFPLNITSESYLDLFKKEDLVYLTPHCYDTMQEYNPDAIYIIGALVDKTQPGPVSLAKAKKENIRMERLPLDRHLQWGPGSGKNLTLNQVLNILLDVRHTNDWQHALRHVPTRKLKAAREYQLRKKMDYTGRMYNESLKDSHDTTISNESINEIYTGKDNLKSNKQELNFENRKTMRHLYKK